MYLTGNAFLGVFGDLKVTFFYSTQIEANSIGTDFAFFCAMIQIRALLSVLVLSFGAYSADGSTTHSNEVHPQLSSILQSNIFEFFVADRCFLGRCWRKRRIHSSADIPPDSCARNSLTVIEQAFSQGKYDRVLLAIDSVEWDDTSPNEVILLSMDDGKTGWAGGFFADGHIELSCLPREMVLGNMRIEGLNRNEARIFMNELAHLLNYRAYGDQHTFTEGGFHANKDRLHWAEPTTTAKTNKKHAWAEAWSNFVEITFDADDLSNRIEGAFDALIYQNKPLNLVRDDITVSEHIGDLLREQDFWKKRNPDLPASQFQSESPTAQYMWDWLHLPWDEKIANESFVTVFLYTMAEKEGAYALDENKIDRVFAPILRAKGDLEDRWHLDFDAYLKHYLSIYPYETERIRSIADLLVGLAPIPDWLSKVE